MLSLFLEFGLALVLAFFLALCLLLAIGLLLLALGMLSGLGHLGLHHDVEAAAVPGEADDPQLAVVGLCALAPLGQLVQRRRFPNGASQLPSTKRTLGGAFKAKE